jgi:hypothetical protein
VIDFRYHVISIVAIFLALATGIALGAGPLGSKLSDGLLGQANRDRETVEAQRVALADAERIEQFQRSFAAGIDAQVLDNLLTGADVTVLTLPGADNRTVDGVIESVELSGAEVVSEVRVSGGLLDPENRTTAENLASQVLDGVDGVPSLEDAGSYEVVGYALAQGLMSTSLAGAEVDPKALEIQSAFEGADYLTYDEKIERRAGLAVVVGGVTDEEADPARAEVLASMLAAADSLSGGVVLAGPPASADENGFVRAVRDSDASDTVSTVDVVDLVSGRVVTTLALAEQATEGVGHYGIGDSVDAPMPEVPEPVDVPAGPVLPGGQQGE